MNIDKIEKILQLKKSDRIKINDEIFTIQKKSLEPCHCCGEYQCKHSPDTVIFELNNNFGLSIQSQDVRFFQNMETNLIFFKTNWQKFIAITKIELI